MEIVENGKQKIMREQEVVENGKQNIKGEQEVVENGKQNIMREREVVENGKQNIKGEQEVVENGKQNIKRGKELAVDAAVDDQLSLLGCAYDLGDKTVKRQRVDDDDVEDEHDEDENDDDSDDDEEYFRNLPLGYGFYPDDDVLIEEYLKPKLFNQPLPRNLINDIDIYLHSPEILAETYKHCGVEDEDDEDQIKEWYYFTPRYRKNPKESRPRRSAGDGYWKSSGCKKQIKNKENTIIGFKKTLEFYKGKPPMSVKTSWMMHEYRLNNPPPLRPTNDIMRLDDCVLCRIYKTKSRIKRKDRKKVGVIKAAN